MSTVFNDSVNRVFIKCFGEHFYKVVCQSWAIVFKTELPSCATIFVLKALTSQEEILLDNPKNFNAFHRSLGLIIDSPTFLSNDLFSSKISFLDLYLADYKYLCQCVILSLQTFKIIYHDFLFHQQFPHQAIPESFV